MFLFLNQKKDIFQAQADQYINKNKLKLIISLLIRILSYFIGDKALKTLRTSKLTNNSTIISAIKV